MPRASLRVVVILVAGLAGLKVWAQDRYYRAIMHEALINAYQDRAATTCQKEVLKSQRTKVAQPWSGPEIIIGNQLADVALWDLDNPLWDVRFRHPNLVLRSGTAAKLRCSYDLTAGLAAIDHPAP
jgi:hypothetical protein